MQNKKPKLVLVKSNPFIEEPDLTYVMKCQQEFHDKFEVPLNGGMQELYKKLVEEEHEEWIEDYYSYTAHEYDELKELADVLYVTAGLAHQMGYKITKGVKYTKTNYDESITDIVSEIANGVKDSKTLQELMYCLYGYANAMGWNLDEAYARVHSSNLSKLGDDGKPVRRDDGKVLKGENYKPPFLVDLTGGN